jgi:nicotinate-nucleotide adenylyltransferase
MGDPSTTIPRRFTRIPQAYRGERIGLFGGSFNPPHEGHLHVAEQALRRLQLDRVWWLVTPGNPLKDTGILAPLAERLAACEELARDRRMVVSALELGLTTRFTADTLHHITMRHPGTDFVWVMGADNLGQFHRWDRWRAIANLLPIAVVDRPGSTMALHNAPAAEALARFRIDEDDSSLLASKSPPAWTFLHGPRNALSSTALRAGDAS